MPQKRDQPWELLMSHVLTGFGLLFLNKSASINAFIWHSNDSDFDEKRVVFSLGRQVILIFNECPVDTEWSCIILKGFILQKWPADYSTISNCIVLHYPSIAQLLTRQVNKQNIDLNKHKKERKEFAERN